MIDNPTRSAPRLRANAARGGTRSLAAALAAALLALGLATPVLADTINVAGNTTGAWSTATVVCEFNSQTNTFTFTTTNTSAITQPGSTATITAIGFDLPPEGNAAASGLNGFTGSQAPSLSSNFDFSDADLGPVPQFADARLDFGFVTAGIFETGNTADGLLPGESASFTVSGAAFAGFTEEQICNALFVRFENVGTGSGLDVGVPDAGTDNILGIANPTLATGIVTCTFNAQTNTFTFSIVNTSPFDARITAIGFDLPPTGNASKSGLNGFTGSAVFQPDEVNFSFSDGALGRVPQVSAAVLDFGFVTGKNFAGGKPSKGLPPGIDPGEEATFVVSGAAFAGLTEDQICDSIVVRFHRVGEDGSLGDVSAAFAAPHAFARAWTDVVDDDTFNAGDVLIAELVDTNRDGVVSVGDTITTNKFPLGFDGATTLFGDFLVSSHTVTSLGLVEAESLTVFAGSSDFVWSAISGFERYLESPELTMLFDNGGLAVACDTLRVDPSSPSQPDVSDVIVGETRCPSEEEFVINNDDSFLETMIDLSS